MITRPRNTYAYDGRSDDCATAIEAEFLDALSSHTGAFVDREAVAARLIDEGAKAGWAQHEISDAMTSLTGKHQKQTAVRFDGEEGPHGTEIPVSIRFD